MADVGVLIDSNCFFGAVAASEIPIDEFRHGEWSTMWTSRLLFAGGGEVRSTYAPDGCAWVEAGPDVLLRDGGLNGLLSHMMPD